MDIGQYRFDEFKEKAAAFHGYPAPGLLLGGYMVEMAKSALPEGTLFDAIVETNKCLPDAIQLLTLCSYGNGWMRVVNLGRYALTLYDKYTGEGVRVFVDSEKIETWPELAAWFFKRKPKREQDSERLFQEIRTCGPNVCSMRPVQVEERFREKPGMGKIALCPTCNEAYPIHDGGICRGCQGEAPYLGGASGEEYDFSPALRAVYAAEAMGKKALHDMTRVDPGMSKAPEFKAGDEITAGDVCRLQQMGRERVYIIEDAGPDGNWVHENEAALAFAKAMAGPGVVFDTPPKEGKIAFKAEQCGLFALDRERLERFNLVPDVMCATRQGDSLVEEDKELAGCRAVPLYLRKDYFLRALAVLEGGPLLSVVPLSPLKTGVLVTGTEVFKGLIEDRFAPIIRAKVEALGGRVVAEEIVPDDREAIAFGVAKLLDAGAELIVTTAGLSVDPDDVTRQALFDAGMTEAIYGAPVLPGTMTLIGRIGRARVLGVPACALFFRITSLDLLLPRIFAGRQIARRDLIRLAEGGLCLGCKVCAFPKCPFGK